MTKPIFTFLLIILAGSPTVLAQAAPAATTGQADLQYAIRYSHNWQTSGSSLGSWQTASPSGELEYQNGSNERPFSLNYSGGYTSQVTGPSYSDGMFQRLLLSQGVDWKKWHILVSDDASYRPQSPVTGFSGIPGIGEPIGGSDIPPPSNQLILSINTHVVENTASGSLGRQLNHATDLSVDGRSDLLRFPDGNAIDTDTRQAGGELTFRLNARNYLWTRYAFYQFSYVQNGLAFNAHSGTIGYQRLWTRALSWSVSAGPEWITGSDSKILPSSIVANVEARIDYHLRSSSASLSYSQDASGGSGYQLGTKSNWLAGSYTRAFGRTFTVGLTGEYRHSSALINNSTISSQIGGVQVSRRLGRYVSFFANYTASNQSTPSSLGRNVQNELLQGAGFGISYTRGIQQHH